MSTGAVWGVPLGTSYQIPNHRVESHNAPKKGIVPQEWRSVGHTHTGIAYECFLDELAHNGGIDPMELRLRLTKDHARMNRVLSVLKEKCDWDKPLAPGRGRGVASRIYNISPVAQAVEVTVAENGDFTVDRVVCVVDCGFAVNPLGIEGQVEGGLAYGLGGVAFGNIDIVNGEVQQSNFHDYPVMRLPQMPKVEVHICPAMSRLPGSASRRQHRLHRPSPMPYSTRQGGACAASRCRVRVLIWSEVAMVLEHMVWLTPKAGVSDDKMEEILASIRALTHIPVFWRFRRDKTSRTAPWRDPWGARHTGAGSRSAAYLNHPDHQAVGVVLREHCEVLALDYER